MESRLARVKDQAMARTTRVVLTCDLHGDDTDAVTTLAIGNNGARYELDVCEEHLNELTGAGRRLRNRRKGRAAGTKKAAKKSSARKARTRRRGSADPAVVREWAKAKGYDISDRGRI